MITPNNNAIIWRNLAKKLRLRQVIVCFDTFMSHLNQKNRYQRMIAILEFGPFSMLLRG